MKYRRFEILVLALGSAVALASIFHALRTNASVPELLGQALAVPVLFFALQYGRRAGFIAAIIAALAYLASRATYLPFSDFRQLGDQAVMISRAAVFGVIGIAGGELAVQLKYVLPRFEHGDQVDNSTMVYSQSHMIDVIRIALGGFERYQRLFTLLIVKIDQRPEDTSVLTRRRRSTTRTRIMREASVALINNVRLVDDVGYWQDGVFMLVLPDTPPDGAMSLADRLEATLRQHLADKNLAGEETLELQINLLSCPEDREVINRLVSEQTVIDDLQEPAQGAGQVPASPVPH